MVNQIISRVKFDELTDYERTVLAEDIVNDNRITESDALFKELNRALSIIIINKIILPSSERIIK